MTLETPTRPTTSHDRPESLARAIVPHNPQTARAKRVVALVNV
jgi:hypothetical protein